MLRTTPPDAVRLPVRNSRRVILLGTLLLQAAAIAWLAPLLSDDARAAMYANKSAVQPGDLARMVCAVLDMPPHVDVARFDILPTHQATATGTQTKGKNG